MSADLVLTDRAALALIDEAEHALGAVETPDDADELWRRIRAVEEAARLARVADVTLHAMVRVRHRAKRRYGELLGPAERPGGDTRSDHVTARHAEPAERKQQERARKLAAIPEEDFNQALGPDTEPAPSEAAVLRKTDPQVHPVLRTVPGMPDKDKRTATEALADLPDTERAATITRIGQGDYTGLEVLAGHPPMPTEPIRDVADSPAMKWLTGLRKSLSYLLAFRAEGGVNALLTDLHPDDLASTRERCRDVQLLLGEVVSGLEALHEGEAA